MINEERWKEIETRKLDQGNHKKFEDGGCVMEMVAYLANEPWSDKSLGDKKKGFPV